jgi:hypothetical protein
MSCPQLDALRTEARDLNRKLIQQRSLARASAHLTRGNQPPGHSDYEPLIKRKLERIAETIKRHKKEHRCEE